MTKKKKLKVFTIEPRFTLSNNRTIETTGGLQNATGCSDKQNKNRKHNKTKNYKAKSEKEEDCV